MVEIQSDKSFIRRYICNVRFAIVAVICVVIVGAVSYYLSTNVQEPADKSQNEHQIVEHTEAPVDDNNNVNSSSNSTVIIPQLPFPSPPKIWENNEEIEIFREYLRIPTVHPDINYKPAVAFLGKQAESLNLPVSIYHPVDDKNPVVVMTWKGSEPELPTIMLNSHMDVVPVFGEFWDHPPFGAEMDENGDIFARGAQDMKSNAMQYLAAIRALKRQGVNQLKLTVHVVFVPDEEVGGVRGMDGFVKTEEFRAMNVGFVLDEGIITLNDEGALYAYDGERSIWQIDFIARGTSGHGSRLLENTPGQKISLLLAKLNEFRDEEMRKFIELKYPYGNLTTINLTILKGGIQNNVVPAEFKAVFDMRISVDTDHEEFEAQLNRWCEESGNITMKFLMREVKERTTAVDNSNPFWVAFKRAVDESGLLVKPAILTGGSDSRFVRRIGIAALGFSPQPNTIPLLHDHNEYLDAVVYLEGIRIYEKIITNLANE